MNPNKDNLYIGLILLILIAMGAFFISPTPIAGTHVEDLARAQNEVKGLKRLLADQSEDMARARELIGSVDSPTEIRYVVQEKIVLVGQTEEVVTIPDYYLFKVNDHIPVAEIVKQNQSYLLRSFDLSITTDIVVGEKETVASVLLESSGAPGETFSLPNLVKVTHVREQALFEPHLGVGVMGSSDLSIGGAIFVSPIHPTKDIDLLSARVGLTNRGPYLGIDPIGYNVGGPLPLLDDLWVYGGVSLAPTLTPQATLTIGSKL